MRFTKGLISVIAAATVVTSMGTLGVNAASKPATTKAKVTNVKVGYNGKKHALTVKGNATKATKLNLQYRGQRVATLKVKAGKFSATQTFKGYGTFKILKGHQTLKKITAKQYATPTPWVIRAERTTKGLHYQVQGQQNASFNLYRQGHYLSTIAINDTNQLKFYLSNAKVKNSSKHLTLTQKVANKKTSQTIKLPVLKVGQVQSTNFAK